MHRSRENYIKLSAFRTNTTQFFWRQSAVIFKQFITTANKKLTPSCLRQKSNFFPEAMPAMTNITIQCHEKVSVIK